MENIFIWNWAWKRRIEKQSHTIVFGEQKNIFI